MFYTIKNIENGAGLLQFIHSVGFTKYKKNVFYVPKQQYTFMNV